MQRKVKYYYHSGKKLRTTQNRVKNRDKYFNAAAKTTHEMVVTESETVSTYVVEKSLEVSQIDLHFLNQRHLFRAPANGECTDVTHCID